MVILFIPYTLQTGVIPVNAGIQVFERQGLDSWFWTFFAGSKGGLNQHHCTIIKAFPLKGLDSSVRWNDASMVECLGYNYNMECNNPKATVNKFPKLA